MAAAEHEFIVYQRGQEGDSDAWDDTILIKAYDNAVSAMKAKLAEQHPEFSVSNSGPKGKKKKRNKGKPKKKKAQQPDSSSKWSPGDLCRAVYTEDGEIYEARILSILEDQRTCTVQYIGYGNEEEQLLSSLLALESASSSQDHKTDTASETESLNQASAAHDGHTGKHRTKKSSTSHHQHMHNAHYLPKGPWDRYSQPPHFSQMAPPPPFPPFTSPPFPGYQAAGPSTSAPVYPCVPPPPPLFTDRGLGEENEALYSMLISWYMSGYHTGYYQGLRQSTANASAASGHGVHR